ncbi:hypothetical protein EC844_12527 [Acinetobacter calcoaceticus]|uniref:Uncharacterized protein n=1 Tax=Acinetobacter calcoaceticus TaxID=471 RepID=A0A4R1XGN8_ACICA|nr:hypothetical protein EC844_12527 [Acinetobacter calcoaceticus]
MRKVFLAVGVISLSCSVSGYELPSEEELKRLVTQKAAIEMQDLECNTVPKIAEWVMERRQDGISIDDQLQKPLTDTGELKIFAKIERQLVVEAYALPKFETSRDKLFITMEFSTKAFINCKKKGV